MTRSPVLACLTGYSYPLIKMEAGAVANNLAFVEYDLALINADHSSQLVVEKLMPMVLDVLVNRIRSTIASMIFSRSNTLNFLRLVEWQPLFDAIFPTMTAPPSRRRTSHCSALKSLFLDSAANNSLGHSVKLNDLP
jgi:hypothetical protein